MAKEIKKQAFLAKENHGVKIVWFNEWGQKQTVWENRLDIIQLKN